MASHILDEVEKVCTHVAIIQKGVLKTVGTVQEVLNAAPTDNKVATLEIEVSADNIAGLEEVLQQLPGILSVSNTGSSLIIESAETLSSSSINKYCFEKGIVLSQLALKKKTLEKRFLEITGDKSDR